MGIVQSLSQDVSLQGGEEKKKTPYWLKSVFMSHQTKINLYILSGRSWEPPTDEVQRVFLEQRNAWVRVIQACIALWSHKEAKCCIQNM